MIQFNLLPDVKIAYIKARRQKQLVITISAIAAAAAVALFVLLYLLVHGVQHKSINDLTDDIKTQSDELIDTPNLNKMLTIQNQLNELDKLHADKPVTSRLFPYLEQLTPANVGISKFSIDYEANTMDITGQAPTVAAVNAFADSLKLAQYNTKENTDNQQAFSAVTLSSLSVSEQKGSQFTLKLTFDPILFDQSQEVNISIKKPDANGNSSSVFDTLRGEQ